MMGICGLLACFRLKMIYSMAYYAMKTNQMDSPLGLIPCLCLLLAMALNPSNLLNAQTEKLADQISSVTESDHLVRKPRPDLTGTVLAKDGSPVQATVFIYTAGPKAGTSPFCPSCYADCQKSEKADEQGHFKIDSLNPQLVFRVLAVAKGFKPQFVGKVDPASGPITVKLDPIELTGAAPGQCLHGRVADAKGKPISGALVSAQGIRGRNGSGRWGSLPGVDPLAVTDDNGEFLISSHDPFDMMDVKVEARGFARRTFAELESGAAVHQLVLTEGAAIRGRVMLNGNPLTNVSVGVVSVDRSMEHYTGNYDIGTDSDGRFLFTSLPPDVDYYIYGKMDTIKAYGSIPIQKIHGGKDGDVTDVGELKVGHGNSLMGRIVLADGGVIPPQTRLLVSRESSWDSVQLTLAADGSFSMTGLPSETISLSLRLPGYRVSTKNASLDTLNPFQLIGRVEGDITNLVFQLEKGDEIPPDYSSMNDESQQPRNRPLHGAEAGPDHSHQWIISGRVTDRQNGDPISSFLVIPGQAQLTWNQNQWDMRHNAEGTNGSFVVYVDQRWAQPELKVTADGFLPIARMLKPESQTNVEILLDKGAGPVGKVLLPDGKPAAKADVIVICADSEQPGFDYDGHLNSRRNAQLETTTFINGNFSFAPQIGMRSIAAATKEGFIQVSVESLKTNSNVVLNAYGSIHGVLKRPSGFGTNEDLDLSFVEADVPIFQKINLANHAQTDNAGRFAFDHVPAGQLQISYRLKMDGKFNGWSQIPLQTVSLNPGQHMEVNITAPERQSPNRFGGQPMPEPVRIPGIEVKGIVLLPNGKPCASAQVALQIPSKYLALGKATLRSNQGMEEGWIVQTRPDGNFALPVYEGAQSVIVVSDEGFAQVSLDDLKQSPQVHLQAWGKIEGELRVGRHPATNIVVSLSNQQRNYSAARMNQAGYKTNSPGLISPPAPDMQPLFYDDSAFQAVTDEAGNFIITDVPPGEHSIVRWVPAGNGSRMQRSLGLVEVKPGETTRISFGGGGRPLAGKVMMTGTNAPLNWPQTSASLHTAIARWLEKLGNAKTPEEKKALAQSAEFQMAVKNAKDYPAELSADGSFMIEDVLPGEYDFTVQVNNHSVSFDPSALALFTSSQEISVPKASPSDSDDVIDVGTVSLKPIKLPFTFVGSTNGMKITSN